MRTFVKSFKETKTTIMVVVVFFLGILTGYLWGREVEKPPQAVWLGNDSFIEVVQKAGGYVYSFGPKSGGGYEFITATSPKADDYPFWANPEKSTKIIRKKIR
jgi:hypothetical protein